MVAAQTSRKSRPLRRKTSHSVIERRRREKINEGLISLQHLVPACRDELEELLLCKAQANKRNARRPQQDVKAEVEATLREKIDTQMVLEKLVSVWPTVGCKPFADLYLSQCIISHTVDYVQELQQKLAAYRHMCRCSPPLAHIDAVNVMTSHRHAHMDEETKDAEGFSLSEEGDALKSESSPEQEDGMEGVEQQQQQKAQCMSCTISRAKRQRHWGSNHPMELSKAIEQRHTSMTTDESHSKPHGQPCRPRRGAAPALLSLREDTASEAETGMVDGKDGQRKHEMSGRRRDQDFSDSDENGSDLALDDWEETRPAHRSPLPVLTATGYDQQMHAAHGRTLSAERAHHHLNSVQGSPAKDIATRRPSFIPGPVGELPSTQPSLLYTSSKLTARRISDGESPSAPGPISSRKRHATGVPKSTASSMCFSTEYSSKPDCRECGASEWTQTSGPIMRPAVERGSSPSDRLLARPHHDNRLGLLADLSAQGRPLVGGAHKGHDDVSRA